MYAISDTDSNDPPGVVGNAIASVEGAAAATYSAVKSAGSSVVTGVESVGSGIAGVVGSEISAVENIGAGVFGSIKWIAIGLLAVGGIYILLTYRQSKGRAF
jgi:phage-related protein